MNGCGTSSNWHTLKNFVKGLPGGLDYEVCRRGVGQKSLVCLARGTAEKTKILVWMKPRLPWIWILMNRVIVMDNGEIREFDSPQNLLSMRTLFLANVKESKNGTVLAEHE
ncbi:Multidrug resistance-associated protein 1 [Orchesella cincta]|uniref:Multidrug resistance-associated protein 1 n=1 Tax=Orchesella cincta TaxID=48709 RepID=A0A1D2MPM2_ORCCI|nr:Multidrug resistance-associated protein 1 [Orchesella cincta]